MADPFDATNSDSSGDGGAFGISPDAWRNLMAFGAATTVAANARDGRGFLTYGTGPLGALGAGALGAMDSSRQNAQARSQLGQQAANTRYLGAETQGRQLQNQLLELQLPFARAKTTEQMRYLQSIAPGGGPAQPQAAPTIGPQSSIGDPDINAAADANGIPRHVAQALFAQESGQGAASPNVGQVLPSTAANPGYGIPPLPADQVNDRKANINFSLNYLARKAAANGITNWNDPAQMARGLALYNGGGDPNYVANVTRRMAPYQVAAGGSTASDGGSAIAPPQGIPSNTPQSMSPQSGVGPNGQMPPQLQAMQNQADAYLAEANRREFIGIPGADTFKLQAQALNKVISDTMTNILKPSDIRPNGMHVNNVTGQVTMPPVEKIVQMPDGSKVAYPSSPMTGAQIPGTMQHQVAIPLADEMNLKERGQGWAKREAEINEQAVNAVGANNTLENMRLASSHIDLGAGASTVQTANTWLLSLGKSLGVDTTGLQDKVANSEDFNKNSVAMVSAATKAVSPRASQQEMQFIAKSQPSQEMSRGGFNMIADQMQGVNDFATARAQALQDYINGNAKTGIKPHGNSGGFDVWFNQQVTPGAFTLQRMTQSPEGQERFKALFSDLNKTPEGQRAARGMMAHFQSAQKLGLFGQPLDGGGQ
jgi:hypothetical protein